MGETTTEMLAKLDFHAPWSLSAEYVNQGSLIYRVTAIGGKYQSSSQDLTRALWLLLEQLKPPQGIR